MTHNSIPCPNPEFSTASLSSPKDTGEGSPHPPILLQLAISAATRTGFMRRVKPRCCCSSMTAQQLFISSPHLDPIAACGEKSHRAGELRKRHFPGWDWARRVTQWGCHPDPHLPSWSLSPTVDKWALQSQQIAARIQSSPSSSPVCLPVFIVICSHFFFQK